MVDLRTQFCGLEVKNPIGVTSCDFGGIQENTYLTPEEVSTCLCRLAQYANELSQVDDGIIVEPTQSTPYSCEPTPAP